MFVGIVLLGPIVRAPDELPVRAKNPDIFVDSKYNMIVLCVEHHRSSNRGIHHVPFPEWILQRNAKNGFEFLI